MIERCGCCHVDSAGNHEMICPCNPVKTWRTPLYTCPGCEAKAEQIAALQAKLEAVERENVRLAQEHTQCHEQNSRLVSEHYTLRAENASLREDLRALAEALRNAADCYDPDNLTMQTRYAAWMRVLARPTVRAIVEGA